MREFLPTLNGWVASEPTGRLGLWWGQPVLKRPFSLLGRVLEYLAGLTVLLDLFGASKIQKLCDRAESAKKNTVVRIRSLPRRYVRSTGELSDKFIWTPVLLAYITTGFSIFWAQIYLLHYDRALSIWLTIAGMILAPAAAAVAASLGDHKVGWASWAFVTTLLLAVYICSLVSGHKMAKWQGDLVQVGMYLLLIAAFAVSLAVYWVCVGVLFFLLLGTHLILLAIWLIIVRLIRSALQNDARPLRWLAFIIFTAGFFLDLLAS